MLRLFMVSSVIPLALAGGVAHDWATVSDRHCFGHEFPTPARTIAFTDNPARATVTVQIVQSAELADLAIAEDSAVAEVDSCGLRNTLRSVTIAAEPTAGEPVVYLTREADADYRVYVNSPQVSAQEAAALLVSSRGGHTRLAAKPFDDEPTGSIHR